MLYAIESDGPKKISKIPHETDFYDPCRARLTREQFQTMYDALFQRIDPTAQEVYTSSWIPGRNWEGTPFQPIFDAACGMSVEAAAKFFGILLWQVVIDRPEAWGFGRYEKDGTPIEGMTYFRLPSLDRG
jgi:hypothetical protein